MQLLSLTSLLWNLLHVLMVVVASLPHDGWVNVLRSIVLSFAPPGWKFFIKVKMIPVDVIILSDTISFSNRLRHCLDQQGYAPLFSSLQGWVLLHHRALRLHIEPFHWRGLSSTSHSSAWPLLQLKATNDVLEGSHLS